MRVLDIPDDPTEDEIEGQRKILEAEIGHPSKTVMIVRNDGPEISTFVDKAEGRAAIFPWRVVVWVKNSKIFKEGQEIELFGRGKSVCAVVLDLDDKPLEKCRLKPDASRMQIEIAFLNAGAGE